MGIYHVPGILDIAENKIVKSALKKLTFTEIINLKICVS